MLGSRPRCLHFTQGTVDVYAFAANRLYHGILHFDFHFLRRLHLRIGQLVAFSMLQSQLHSLWFSTVPVTFGDARKSKSRRRLLTVCYRALLWNNRRTKIARPRRSSSAHFPTRAPSAGRSVLRYPAERRYMTLKVKSWRVGDSSTRRTTGDRFVRRFWPPAIHFRTG